MSMVDDLCVCRDPRTEHYGPGGSCVRIGCDCVSFRNAGLAEALGQALRPRDTFIYAFDHQHAAGDVCSRATCEAVRNKVGLVGRWVVYDMRMLIVRPATADEYLNQPIPDGWCIPPLEHGCENFYEVKLLP